MEDSKIPIAVDDVVLSQSLEEVGTAVKKLKNNNAAGSDGLPLDLFKAVGDILVGSMHPIICRV